MSSNKAKRLGVMIDMSRNSVMSVEGLKRFLPLLRKFGYNCVMLYTEDTYELECSDYFGYFRGRYTKKELAELDEFASCLGIELIPCVQTLAHLNAFLRWGKVPVDCNDILLADDERTYAFIDSMLKEISQTFRSKTVHVGMDEAWMLGRGRHLDLHGFEEKTPIMKRHLEKVSESAEKYGLEPIFWSDMFFYRLGGYYQPKTELDKETVESLPKNMTPVYWDYYHDKESDYDDMIYNHKQLCRDVWFAGGAWCWSGQIPLNTLSLNRMRPAMRSCRKNGIKNIFITLWGDNGGECSHFSQLPALYAIAQYAKGNEDGEKIRRGFKAKTGMDFDEFMSIELPNTQGKYFGQQTPSKNMLFSDCFCGFLDYTVKDGVGKEYALYADMLAKTAKKSRRFGYVFKAASALCSVLEYKYELGVKTRRAYKNGDKAALLSLAQNEYTVLTRLIPKYLDAFRRQWYFDNKPYGFDIQELRIGGLAERIRSCRARLLDYCAGKLDSIPELEEDILPLDGERGVPSELNVWSEISSCCVI